MNKFPPKNEPLPLNADKTFIKKLETAVGEVEEFEVLEKEFDFKYKSATGELIFAMVTARCDISFACVKLCQYNNCPARIHFEAVRDILLCMRGTKEDGIHFWRKTKNKSLPKAPYPSTRSAPDIPNIALHPTRPYVYADSDWASDYATRKSVSGIALMFAEAIILYKTQFQKATALSSTEGELYALFDARKMTLYIRSVLDELGMNQEEATHVFEDNQGCLQLVNTNQPTRRTKHIEVRQFAILDNCQLGI